MKTVLLLQFTVLEQVQDLSLVGGGEWMNWRFAGPLDLVAMAFGHRIWPVGSDRQGAAQRTPQRRVPGPELAVEIVTGIALAAPVDPPGAVGLELGVNQLRRGLIGGRPIAVATAKDGIVDPLQGRGLQRVAL